MHLLETFVYRTLHLHVAVRLSYVAFSSQLSFILMQELFLSMNPFRH